MVALAASLLIRLFSSSKPLPLFVAFVSLDLLLLNERVFSIESKSSSSLYSSSNEEEQNKENKENTSPMNAHRKISTELIGGDKYANHNQATSILKTSYSPMMNDVNTTKHYEDESDDDDDIFSGNFNFLKG